MTTETMNNVVQEEELSLDQILAAAGALDATATTAQKACRVYISRTGKRQLVIDAYVGDNLAEVLKSKGFDYAGLGFAKEIGDDQLEPLGDVTDVTLGEGTHKLHANKNVIGG